MFDIVNWALGNKFQWKFRQNKTNFCPENAFTNVVREMATILFRPECVNLQTIGIDLTVLASDFDFHCYSTEQQRTWTHLQSIRILQIKTIWRNLVCVFRDIWGHC